MATEAQISANRANAQLSCGPKSEEGKAKCSRNAVRHGLTARGFIVLPGLEDEFTALETQLRINLQPIGALEESMFKVILESTWNLERCRRAQAQLYAQAEDAGVDPLLDNATEAKYGRIQNYANRYQKAMFKAMSELGHLQTEVLFRHRIHPISQAVANDPVQLAKTPHSLSAVADFRKVIEPVKPEPEPKPEPEARPEKSILQNRANFTVENVMSYLDSLPMPPSVRRRDPDLAARKAPGAAKEVA